jgi:hypothetical protein
MDRTITRIVLTGPGEIRKLIQEINSDKSIV